MVGDQFSRLAFAVGLCTHFTIANAQDNSFVMGMTFESAKKLADSRGTPLKGFGSQEGAYTIGEPRENQGNVQFCNGRLFLRSEFIAGGVDGFAERLEQLGQAHGYPKVGARSGHTSTGYVSEVSMVWELEGAVELRLSIISIDGKVSTNFLESAQEAICK